MATMMRTVDGVPFASTRTHIAGLRRSGYDGGDREKAPLWMPSNRPADSEILSSFNLITARGRYLGRNNPLCVGAKRTIIDNLLGTGVQTFSAARGNDGKLLTQFNDKSDELYEEWCEHADASGRRHFHELCRINLASSIESGSGLLLQVRDPSATTPSKIRFQSIEIDQLDTSMDRPGTEYDNEIRNGIEIDKFGRRVAYYIFNDQSIDGPSFMNGSERVPSGRVIHLYRDERPGQTLGVTWFAPIVMALWNAYQYMDAEIEAAKLAAFFVTMWKKDGGDFPNLDAGTNDDDEDEYGNAFQNVRSGMFLKGGPQDDFSIVTSNRANAQAVPWLKFLLQMMGVGVGLSQIRFTGDFSEVNFSSSRAADNQDRKSFEPLQFWHNWYVDQEIRRRITTDLILSEQLPVPSGGLPTFFRNRRRLLAIDIINPGWMYVDPEKQVAASTAAIKAGLSSWREEVGQLGWNFKKLLKQNAEDREMIREFGMDPDQMLDVMPKNMATSNGADDGQTNRKKDQVR